MLMLGAGQQGSACACDLLKNSDHRVVLADLSTDPLPDFLAPYLSDGRLKRLVLDASDDEAVYAALKSADVAMSALPWYFNLRVAELAVNAGTHFCDLGGNTEIATGQKRLDERARAAGVSLVTDCGLAPGMVNILAAYGIHRMDHPREVYMKVGGLPRNPEPPLRYQVVYSLEGVIDYYTTLSWILRDGRLERVDALSEVEEVFMPEVGVLEAFHTAGGLSLMAQGYREKLDRMEYKTLRYPGHAEVMRAVRDLGLLSDEPVEVDGCRVAPRDLFLAAAGPRLRKDPRQSPDLVVLRVDVVGEREGRLTTLRWELLDRYDPETGITAMMRTTGFSLAITALMQLDGTIPPGAWTPDEVVPAGEYIGQLGARGINISCREINGRPIL
jgi:lysine 6-dehydrogenase